MKGAKLGKPEKVKATKEMMKAQTDMSKVKDKAEMMYAMKKIDAMYKKESTNKRYLQTKPGSIEEAVLISRGLVKDTLEG